MIHHNGPFIPHYGPYRNYMEDGMPGTPLKIWGFLVGLIGGIAGGIVAISGLNPIIGAFVALGAIIVGIILAGFGMAKNYQENKKIRELKIKNLQQQNKLLENGPVLLDNGPVLPIAPVQPFPLAPVPPFTNNKLPPMLAENKDINKPMEPNMLNSKGGPFFPFLNKPSEPGVVKGLPLMSPQKMSPFPLFGNNLNKEENKNISKPIGLFNNKTPNLKEEQPFPFLKEPAGPFAKGIPPMFQNAPKKPPFTLFGNDLNKEADDINAVEKKDLGKPMFPLFENKEAPNENKVPNFMQPNLTNNKNILSNNEEDYDDDEEEEEAETEVKTPEKKEAVSKNQTPLNLPFPDFLKGNPLFAQKPAQKPISEGVTLNTKSAEPDQNVSKK